MSVTPDTVRALLNEIVDPCSRAAGAPAGLVDMGLVYDVKVEWIMGATHISVVLGTTDPRCLMGAVFLREARERLAMLPGVASTDVQLDHTRLWTEQSMAADYTLKLQQLRAQRRIGGVATDVVPRK